MYAVVEIAGQQFKVAKDQRLYVHRLNANKGDNVDFDNVLLVDNDGKVNVGAPAISGARVTAKVLGHLKGDKVIVFKKKRRKGYQKSNGHRQYLTQIEIQSILETGAKAKAKEEKPAAKAEPKAEAKAAPSKKEIEVSGNLVTRAEHRADDAHVEIDIDKVLQSIGTALKADADDLKLINGIGPVFEEKLNELGIYTFEQISNLKAADREELSAIDGITRDKIEDDEWVKQAKKLLKNK